MISVTPYKEMFSSRLHYDLPSVFSHLNVLDDGCAKKISSYLENGLVLFEFVSPVPSIIDKKTLVPYVLYSDGEYCWDGMLLHLVKEYSVELPKAFIDYILGCEFLPNQSKVLNRDEICKEYMANKEKLRYLLVDGLQVSLSDLISTSKH